MKARLTIAAILLAASCAPSPECDQACADQVNQALRARAELDGRANAGDVEAIKQVIREEWAGSGESEAWLFAIVWRESNFLPWAHNQEGASGLFQIMEPMHNDKFTAVGCNPSQWAEARCNARAARYLYGLDSRHPWYLAGWHQ